LQRFQSGKDGDSPSFPQNFSRSLGRIGHIVVAMSTKPVSLTLLLLPFVSPLSPCQASPANQSQTHLQRPDLAIPEFWQLVALDPANVEALGNLGVLLFFAAITRELFRSCGQQSNFSRAYGKVQALLGIAEVHTSDFTNAPIVEMALHGVKA
jgi:hypothetical protein